MMDLSYTLVAVKEDAVLHDLSLLFSNRYRSWNDKLDFRSLLDDSIAILWWMGKVFHLGFRGGFKVAMFVMQTQDLRGASS